MVASIKNNRYELTQKKRLGNGVPAIRDDEFTTKSQVIAKDGSGNVATVIPFTANNTHSGTETFSGPVVSSLTTESTSSITGAIKTAGGLGVAKNLQVGSQLVTSKLLIANHTGVAINTTGAGTLTVVTSGVVAGLITSTSAAGVTITLDSIANMITAFATAGAIIATGTNLQFIIDNSQGASTVTLAVDSGATIAVATSAITGGATLTVSTANKIGLFNLYLTSATAGILSRVI